MADRPQISARHRRESTRVSTFGAGERIEIQLGHLCNNRCVFCASGQMTQLKVARPIPAEPVFAALEQAARDGVRQVTLMGGEPTLQKSFLPAVRKAAELGFEEVVIFTNGVRLPQKGFVEEVCGLGPMFTWRISIQGATKEAHERVTGRVNSFDRILAGLEKLRALGRRITVNMCVNEHSYRSLPRFADLLPGYGVAELHVDVIRPQDAGARSDDYLADIMATYSSMAPFIREMLVNCEAAAPEMDVNVGNLPFCLLPEWTDRIQHGGQLTTTYAAEGAGRLQPGRDKYAHQSSDKVFGPGCDSCVFRGRCDGVAEGYARRYGTDELKPMSLAELRAVDGRQGAFGSLMEADLGVLLQGAPPAGLRLGTVRIDHRARRVEVQVAGAIGEPQVLVFVPSVGGRPVGAGPVLLSTDRFSMRISGGAGHDPRDVGRLLAWVQERFDGLDGLLVIAKADPARLTAALRLLAAGRQNDQKLPARPLP